MILSFLTAIIFENIKVNRDIQLFPAKIALPDGILRGSISLDKDLPEEFYGSWAVKSTIIESNNPEIFNKKSTDIWSISRNGDVITLSNPVSGATASITVNEVVGKRAKFTRRKETAKYIETETPELTIEGATFYGEDKLIIKYLHKDKIYKTDVVKYKLEGLKLSGPTLKDLFVK